MNVKIKFIKYETTWDKIITDENDNIINQELGLMLTDEINNKDYFDGWENQIRKFLDHNVINVERFI
jgi:hypothetical protein